MVGRAQGVCSFVRYVLFTTAHPKRCIILSDGRLTLKIVCDLELRALSFVSWARELQGTVGTAELHRFGAKGLGAGFRGVGFRAGPWTLKVELFKTWKPIWKDSARFWGAGIPGSGERAKWRIT